MIFFLEFSCFLFSLIKKITNSRLPTFFHLLVKRPLFERWSRRWLSLKKNSKCMRLSKFYIQLIFTSWQIKITVENRSMTTSTISLLYLSLYFFVKRGSTPVGKKYAVTDIYSLKYGNLFWPSSWNMAHLGFSMWSTDGM